MNEKYQISIANPQGKKILFYNSDNQLLWTETLQKTNKFV